MEVGKGTAALHSASEANAPPPFPSTHSFIHSPQSLPPAES